MRKLIFAVGLILGLIALDASAKLNCSCNPGGNTTCTEMVGEAYKNQGYCFLKCKEKTDYSKNFCPSENVIGKCRKNKGLRTEFVVYYYNQFSKEADAAKKDCSGESDVFVQ